MTPVKNPSDHTLFTSAHGQRETDSPPSQHDVERSTTSPPRNSLIKRRSLLKLGVTGALAASGLSLTADRVTAQDVGGDAKDVASQWQTAFNEGDIDTLRSLYGDDPRNSLIPAGETPRGMEFVLSFNRLTHAMEVGVEVPLDELSMTSSEPVQLQGPATLRTVPMGSLAGEAEVKLQENDGTLRVTDFMVSIPFEVLLESWGEPGELPPDAEPLTDMEPGETFQGRPGGLYGGYQNVPPLDHQEAAVRALNRIQPRDEAGIPSDDGTVGFVTLGPSNTWNYSDAFINMARQEPDTAPYLWMLNGCEGTFTSDARAWTLGDYPAILLNHKLEKPGYSREQVQVAWYTPHYYHDMQEPIEPLEYAEDIHGYVREMLPRLKANFPNLEIIYLSGFPYLGYAKTGFSEPMAYEMNLAVRSLIQAQMEGDSRLNYDPDQGEVRAPLLLWGSYLWAKGETPRSDGLTWSPADYQEVDGAHPSAQGAKKVGELLLEFMKTNQFARSWYLDVEPPAIEDLEAPTPVATPTRTETPSGTSTETTVGETPGFGPLAALAGIGGAAGYHLYKNRDSEQ